MCSSDLYEEWLCYQKLLSQQQDLIRKEKEDLERRKAAADASSIRRAQLSSMRSSASRNTVTGAPKTRSLLPNLTARDRDDLTQNMGNRFIEVDLATPNLAPKTPEAGFQATAAYLLANPPPANTPQAAGYNNAIAGLGL